jgi:adenosylcobinamide-phosphate synthase
VGLTAAAAVALAVVLDAAVGEPPTRVHPVAWFGRLVAPFDREWTHPLAVGASVALVLPFAAALAVGGLVALAGRIAPELAAAVAGLALFAASSRRMLLREARAVVDGTETDLDAARGRLRSLAGRDAADLSAGQVRSAAVESAAENLADGLVAPLLAFAVGAFVSLPVAAGAAAWVKGVNTLDSMLGYREKRVGTPSARLDDAVMWLPARLSALLLAATTLLPGAVVRARSHAAAPPSPNSGWPMATLAAVLGVRLQKPGVYDLPLGDAFPTVAESRRGVRAVGTAGLLAAALAAGVVAWS